MISCPGRGAPAEPRVTVWEAGSGAKVCGGRAGTRKEACSITLNPRKEGPRRAKPDAAPRGPKRAQVKHQARPTGTQRAPMYLGDPNRTKRAPATICSGPPILQQGAPPQLGSKRAREETCFATTLWPALRRLNQPLKDGLPRPAPGPRLQKARPGRNARLRPRDRQ